VTTVRIVFALQSLRAARAPDGSEVPDWRLHQRLIVLVDTVPAKDGGHRAVPLWLRVFGHKELLGRVAWLSRPGQPAADAEVASGLLETAVRLLRTAGTEVSAVDIQPTSDDVPELRWDTVTARVGLATATGTRPVTVSAEYGLALAAVAGAPVRVADTVMDRLAVSVPDEDVLVPFLPLADARPPGSAGRERRFEPRNMGFTGGLDYWERAGSFSDDGPRAGPDYSCTADDGSAALAASVPEPAGSAVLVQTIYAEDYRGRTVTFRGQLRTTDLAGQAGLQLTVSGPRSESTATSPLLGQMSSLIAPGSSDWAWHEVTAPVPGGATAIRFGISLAGHGRIELRGAELTPAPSETRE
jgi:hypothetical protein